MVDKEEIIGSVACYGNEIDDLIVSQEFQRQGYGKQLLLWAIWHIRERSNEPITLHVAAWNQGAIMLYEKCGFTYAGEKDLGRGIAAIPTFALYELNI